MRIKVAMRTKHLLPCTLLLLSACGFYHSRTPSGFQCSDMPVLPDRQPQVTGYHRIGVLKSDPRAETLVGKQESLRRAACAMGADAVVDVTLIDVPGGLGLAGNAAVVTR